jgi:hypothetical protein
MKVLFEYVRPDLPRVSIILLDWSCRESFHILEYLKNQTIPREQYEIIWIEYYNKHSSEIKTALEECRKLDKQPVIDKWIVMDMPDNVYYHKHLMYNIGILASRGEIVTICDSDAVVSPTFVKSIIEAFQGKPNIVLHMDEVKNTDKRFYPFNYPALSQITGKGCINWKNGTTIGLLDKEDFLHTRNYGACMCALRKDLIDIGGADEHISYLGHICGPYEITFRMVNAGKKEIWHQKEFLYHTWHPGTDGRNNYLGPHDGYNMSTVALDSRKSLRILPLVENTAIKMLRTNSETVLYDSLLSQAIPVNEMLRWKPQREKRDLKLKIVKCLDAYRKLRNNSEYFLRYFKINITLYCAVISLIVKQIFNKSVGCVAGENKVMKKSLFLNVRLFFVFFWRMLANNIYTIKLCKQSLKKLSSKGIKEIAIYGTGFTSKILCIIAGQTSLKIQGIYDKSAAKDKYLRYEVFPHRLLTEFNGKIIIANMAKSIEKAMELKEIGVQESNIIIIGQH